MGSLLPVRSRRLVRRATPCSKIQGTSSSTAAEWHQMRAGRRTAAPFLANTTYVSQRAARCQLRRFFAAAAAAAARGLRGQQHFDARRGSAIGGRGHAVKRARRQQQPQPQPQQHRGADVGPSTCRVELAERIRSDSAAGRSLAGVAVRLVRPRGDDASCWPMGAFTAEFWFPLSCFAHATPMPDARCFRIDSLSTLITLMACCGAGVLASHTSSAYATVSDHGAHYTARRRRRWRRLSVCERH